MTQPVVGQAAISISPELDKSGMAAFRQQIRAATSSAARSARSSLRQEFGRLPQIGNISEEMQKQRTRAQQELRRTTRIYQGEADAWRSLQTQKARAISESTRIQKQKLAEVSRAYDTQLLAAKTALRSGQVSNTEYARSANQIMTSARSAGLSIEDLTRKQASLASLTETSFTESLYKAGSAMSQIGTRVGMLGFQMQLLGRTMTQFISLPIAGSLAAASYVGLKQAAQIEQAMRGMVALRPNENIVPFFNRMLALAKTSPVFEAGPLLDSIRGLAAANIPTRKIEELVNAMGRIGLTVGVTGPEMTLAFKALEEMAAKGKVSMEELRRQLGNSIPGVMQMIAEGMGVSVPELFKRVSKGMNPNKIFAALIKVGNTGRFMAGATSGVQTLNSAWQGLLETAKITLAEQFLDERFRVRPEITEGLQRLTKSLSSLIKSLGDAGAFDMAINGFARFVEIIDKLVQKYEGLNDAQKQSIPKFALMAAAIGPVMQTVAPLFSTIAMGIGAFGTLGITLGSVATPAGAAAVAVLGVSAALTTLFTLAVAKSERFRTKMASVLRDWVGMFDDWVMPAINGVWQQLVLLGRELNSLGIDWELVGDAIKYAGVVLIGSWAVILRSVQGSIGFIRMQITQAVMVFQMFTKAVSVAARAAADVGRFLNKIPGVVPSYMQSLPNDLDKIAGGAEGASRWLDGYTRSTNDVRGSSFSLEGALGGLGGMFDSNTTKALTMGDAIDQLRDKMNLATTAAQNNKAADEAWASAKSGLTASLKANNFTLDESTVKGRANAAAFAAATKASYDRMLMDIRSGVPMQQAIARHKARTDQLVKEAGKTKETTTQAKALVDTYGAVPKNVRTLLKLLGFPDVEKKMLDLYVNQRALKQGSTLSVERARVKKLLGDSYATGGYTGPGPKLQPAGIVHAGEHVIKKDSRSRMEKANPGLLDFINRTGHLPGQYAAGGTVAWPFPVDVRGTKIDPRWGQGGFASSGGSGGPGGWVNMYAWIANAMRNQVRLTSGLRPGDPGYHGMGRAVDLTFPDGSERTGGGLALKAFNLIKSQFFGSIKELIWDFAGNNAVWNGRNHFFTGAGAGPGTHNDHIHWAHDNGGPVYDGMMTGNYSGRTELMLNNSQSHALEDRIRGGGEVIEARVYLDGEPIRAAARVEIQKSNESIIGSLKRGRKGGG